MILTHYHDPEPQPYAEYDFECSKRLRSLRNSQEDMLERRVLTILLSLGLAIIGACRWL